MAQPTTELVEKLRIAKTARKSRTSLPDYSPLVESTDAKLSVKNSPV
jgi:hypothetical protein